ncbi:MAG: hypothetical protein H6755_01400 [Candidatus Omnitrophica bacterium]|nr:hypothetical protein [Candidatus Omnitrophota bacterium]
MNKERRYIFSINTGRAGSEYLSTLLAATNECESCHEAYPNFASDMIRKVNILGNEATLDLQRIKINYLKNLDIKKTVYADTSHIFIKSWYYAAVKDLENIMVIWLKRNKEEIIKSLIRLKAIPNKTVLGNNWYLRTDYPTNLLSAKSNLSDYQLCDWYVSEIEARALYFKKSFPNIPFFSVNLEDLNSYEYVCKLFSKLNLTPTDGLKDIVGKKINMKRETKKITLIQRVNRKLKRSFIKCNPFKNRNRIHIIGDGIY